MKKSVISIVLSLLFFSALSQSNNYGIRDVRAPAILKSELIGIQFIGDFISGYPRNWIKNYLSVEVLAQCDGQLKSAISPDDQLSAAQKDLLKSVDIGSDIIVNVSYKEKNTITGVVQNEEINLSMIVVPDVEAQYKGGQEAMKQYFIESGIDKISQSLTEQSKLALLRFKINEDGEVSNAEVFISSGDPFKDELLLSVLQKMPKWKPAMDANGRLVKQTFEFMAGVDGC